MRMTEVVMIYLDFGEPLTPKTINAFLQKVKSYRYGDSLVW